jgi:hypothetical protein
LTQPWAGSFLDDPMPEQPATSASNRWLQFSLRGLLVLIALCGLLFWWLRPEVLDERYFPIEVGDRWIYESEMGDVVFHVTGRQKVGPAECFVVQRKIGDHQTPFYVSVARDGVRIHQVDDDVYNPPYRQFAFPTQEGQAWRWEGKIGAKPSHYACFNEGLETTDVPLGAVRAIRVRQAGGNVLEAEFWVAKGLGVVRLSGKSWDEHDPAPQPLYFEWRLKEYRRATRSDG